MTGFPVTIRNEFAMVVLSLAPTPSGPVLQIQDETSGIVTTFDAMELEALCWLTPDDRRRLLSPEHRYGDTPPDGAQ